MRVDALESCGQALPPLLVECRDAAAQPCDRLGQLGALAPQAGDARFSLGGLALGHQIDRADAVALAHQPIEPGRRLGRIWWHFVRGETGKFRQSLGRLVDPLADLAGQGHQCFVRALTQHFGSGPLLARLGQRLIGEPGILRCLAQPGLR